MARRTLDSLGLGGHTVLGARPDGDIAISGIAVDSRSVIDGTLFVAIPGTRLDGAAFAQYAVRQGASAVLGTADGYARALADFDPFPVPWLVDETPRATLADLAARWFDAQPDVMVAVTGTNGKTSVAQFVGQIWARCGYAAASLGTTGVTGAGFAEPLDVTTPEPLTLHALLARLASKGCTHAAMEASSHGLAQHRIDGVRLAAGALTNITRDHMDYHPTHADYVAAKLRLFRAVLAPGGAAVIHADDPVSAEAKAAAEARGLRTLMVGRGADADLRIVGQGFSSEGQSVTLSWQGTDHTVPLTLVGAFQADNVAVAAALAIATGTPASDVFGVLSTLDGVRGRMELAGRRRTGAAVYVDYAHTPDALRTALAALRPHCRGRLVCVFGAGGDRDPGKRVLMGQAVAEGADIAIVTDDNPRGEDPAAIRAAVMAGCPDADEIGDRTEAILAGVDCIRSAEDCLLVAGKGHEQGQEVGGAVLPFDDVTEARTAIAVLDGEDPGDEGT